MIHDEEAPTVLELCGRIGTRVNEIVAQINENTEDLEAALKKLPADINAAIMEEIENGNLERIVGTEVMKALKLDIAALEARIDSIITSAGDGNTEIVDARTSILSITYSALAKHLHAIETGEAFSDAVRPGTVKAGRISAGMLTGEARDMLTVRERIPLAGHWNQTGYIGDDLEITAHSGYYISDPIPCTYGDVFLIDTWLFGPLVYAAAVTNSSGQVLYVGGKTGLGGDWAADRSEVHITRSDAAYIRVITGTGYASECEVYRVSMRRGFNAEDAMYSRGYIRTRAKKRTDTITDRAQIKCWFKLPETREAATTYQIPISFYKWYNLSGFTFRVFAATSTTSYDQQLPESAAAYTFAPANGIRPFFTVPLTADTGEAYTHVCLLVDLLPAREEDYIEAFMPLLSMGNAEGIGYTLHGALEGDHISHVLPGASDSHLYGATIMGIGDSLMAADGLTKRESWFDLMAGYHDMIWYNAAVNGRAVAGTDSMASNFAANMTAAVAGMGRNPDYLIVQGGANDLRLNVPLDTFRNALRDIVTAARATSNRVRILFVTNWRRSDYVNPLGHKEGDYVAAMIEVAEELGIAYYNSYARSLNLKDPATLEWAELGSIHFNADAHQVIAHQIGLALEEV